jgi:hypothetical protein
MSRFMHGQRKQQNQKNSEEVNDVEIEQRPRIRPVAGQSNQSLIAGAIAT